VPHRVSRVALTAAVLLALTPSAHASTLYAANDGVDGAACGPKTSPCRSIGQTMANAAAGDTIIVGPGKYGDLDGDGTPGDSPGEENPALNSPGCGCMLALNKAVTLESSNGAAETLIDGRSVASGETVLLITDGGTFGTPGKGFFVTQSGGGNKNAMVIDSNNVAVRGNQIIPVLATSVGIGIQTVDSGGSVVIEGNQLVGWATAIYVQGANKTVRNNAVLLSFDGIAPAANSLVSGNAAIGNEIGIFLASGAQTVVGNAAISNTFGISNTGVGPSGFGTAFNGTVEKNDIVGNICGMGNDGVTGLVADKNYWGAATGPGAAPGDDTCNSSGGTTTVTPFAKARFKVKPSIKP